MPAYTQGLMDLGATVCTARRPACVVCPLNTMCAAAREGQPLAYPVNSRRSVRGSRENWWLWLEHDGCIWLEQRPSTGVWAGLWSLPVFDSEESLHDALVRGGLGGVPLERQPQVRHALTHFDWTLHPRRLVLRSPDHAAAWGGRHRAGIGVAAGEPGPGELAVHEPVANMEPHHAPAGRWIAREDLPAHGLPAPLKKLLG